MKVNAVSAKASAAFPRCFVRSAAPAGALSRPSSNDISKGFCSEIRLAGRVSDAVTISPVDLVLTVETVRLGIYVKQFQTVSTTSDNVASHHLVPPVRCVDEPSKKFEGLVLASLSYQTNLMTILYPLWFTGSLVPVNASWQYQLPRGAPFLLSRSVIPHFKLIHCPFTSLLVEAARL